VAWRIHAVMQDSNDGNSIVRDAKVNDVPLNTATPVTRADVITGWRNFG